VELGGTSSISGAANWAQLRREIVNKQGYFSEGDKLLDEELDAKVKVISNQLSYDSSEQDEDHCWY
jgi:hypothetical protein